MAGPLTGIHVLELGIWVAVPSAAAVLADWGATVVKIEPPDGDPLRGLAATGLVPYQPDVNPAFQLDNRGKQSIVLDLRRAEAREVAHRLVARADVFVTNIRRQKLVALAMDAATLRALNPRLIYAALTGYGTTGPEADRAAFDYAAFWARAGIMASLGEPEGPPPTQRPGMGDHMTGLGLAGAIAAALLARERSGVGQEIATSLFANGLWMLGSDIQAAITTGYCHTPGGRRAAPNPLFNFYRTKDGRWLHLIMLQPDRHWSAFCAAIDRPDLARDPRFADAPSRFRHCRELIAILDPLFAARTLAAWAEALDRAGCYWGTVQSVAEVAEDPQAAAIEAFATVALPDGRPLRLVKSPTAFSSTPAAVAGPAPELGQHTEEVLLDAGYGWDDIARLKDAGALG
ncbi:MAG TPA: CoA transferase [Candidatus Binatia bacterium]|nr:CoA transferase [Candidatus Binatia bacterium]